MPVGQRDDPVLVDAPMLVGVTSATLDDASEAVDRVSHLASDADLRADVKNGDPSGQAAIGSPGESDAGWVVAQVPRAMRPRVVRGMLGQTVRNPGVCPWLVGARQASARGMSRRCRRVRVAVNLCCRGRQLWYRHCWRRAVSARRC